MKLLSFSFTRAVLCLLVCAVGGATAKKGGGGSTRSSNRGGTSYQGHSGSGGGPSSGGDLSNTGRIILFLFLGALSLLLLGCVFARFCVEAFWRCFRGKFDFQEELRKASERVGSSGRETSALPHPKNGSYEASYSQDGGKEVAVKLGLSFHLVQVEESFSFVITGTGKDDNNGSFTISEGRMSPSGKVFWVQQGNGGSQRLSRGVFDLFAQNQPFTGLWVDETGLSSRYTDFAYVEDTVDEEIATHDESVTSNGDFPKDDL